MDKELLDWTICGRAIGKATGWDQADTWVMQLYGFQPGAGYAGPVAECVSFNFEKGLVESYDETGDVVASVDLIEAVGACPVDRID